MNRAERLAEIRARHHAGSAEPALVWGTQAVNDRGYLLTEVQDASDALTAAGIPDDGRSLAERIMALAKERDGFASTIDPVAQAALDLGRKLPCEHRSGGEAMPNSCADCGVDWADLDAEEGGDPLPDLCLDFSIKAKDALRLKVEALALHERLAAAMPATDPRRTAVEELRSMLTDGPPNGLDALGAEIATEDPDAPWPEGPRFSGSREASIARLPPEARLAILAPRLLTLRVRFTDEQAAAEVTPEQANAYLAARGWTWLGAAIWNVWRREDEEVLVPTATEAHDYGEAMAHLINRLASTEGRSALAVWVDMTATTGDTCLETRADIAGGNSATLTAIHRIAQDGEQVTVSELWTDAAGAEVSAYRVTLPLATLVHVVLNTTAEERAAIDQRADWRGVPQK